MSFKSTEFNSEVETPRSEEAKVEIKKDLDKEKDAKIVAENTNLNK